MGVTIKLAGVDPDLWVKQMQDLLEGECRVLARLKNRLIMFSSHCRQKWADGKDLPVAEADR